MSFCPSCGSQNAEGARFCEKCGGPLEVAQPAAASQDLQQAAGQATQAISSAGKAAGKAVGRLNPVLLIAAGVAVVVLLLGYFLFFSPMSEADYEDAADEYTADLMDAQTDITNTLDEYYYSDYPDDELSGSDITDMRDAYKEGAEGIKKAASDIRAMRPPGEYKSADKRLNDWAEYMSGDYLDALEELLAKQEAGRSYGRLSEDISRYYDDISKDQGRAWRDYTRAANDLGIYVEGD